MKTSTRKILGWILAGLLLIMLITVLSIVTTFKVAIILISTALCITYLISLAIDLISAN